ncbi:YbaB/EbfC DNA-binding family protein [Saccharothrix saharensis]|uniref:YbaB/EbfC DNA-binding family protein n=1 Tax=Saccharothrix saharensis TaxID=571190 RepID=A0A543JJK3_9PSEU|nr:YbaB/EbfC family nucleoid-associated protein [Saccharothrix saharensis]TQM83042.1 YbaB/EbfC DNA-binding family protein [Saccharothrix saharensis]
MDQGILDPDGARERLAAWKGRFDKLAADTRVMSERLQGIRVTAGDPGGLAEVTVDSTGAMVDLRLTDRIGRVAPAVVARAILATLGDAKSQVADRTQEIIAETMGPDSAAGKAMADNVGRHLRGGPAPQRRAPAGEDDDDYGGHSYLQDR